MTSNPHLPPAGKRRTAGRIAAWAAVATIGALALTGVALAAPTLTAASGTAPAAAPSPSSADPSAKAAKGPRGKHKGLRGGHLRAPGRAVHAEAVVKDKDGKFITVYTQRGKVTAVSATSITLNSDDGFTATYTVNADTKIGKDGKPAKIGDVKVGDSAGLFAVKSGESKNARGIRVGEPKKDDD